jgi:hypothetical protein
LIKRYREEEFQEKRSLLKEKFGSKKEIPENFELAALLALSHFPELKEIKIKFIIRNAALAFASRPDWKTMFRDKNDWEYLIVISNRSNSIPEKLLLKNIPFNAQIGILGHELSHTVYYLNKSLKEMTGIGIKYLNSDYRIKFESETDKETIRRGLGWQLLEFANYCRSFSAEKKMIDWLNKYYLDPKKIRDYMKTIPDYNINNGKN